MNENTRKTLFSSKSEHWETPQELFDALDREFHFTLDPCASPENAKCKKFFTEDDDGLKQDWGGHRVFMNPPFSREYTKRTSRRISDWIRKAYLESQKPNTIVVCLLPARTDTKWWHNYVMLAPEVRFVKGRLKFGDQKNSAPFPSVIVIFGDYYRSRKHPRIRSMTPNGRIIEHEIQKP